METAVRAVHWPGRSDLGGLGAETYRKSFRAVALEVVQKSEAAKAFMGIHWYALVQQL